MSKYTTSPGNEAEEQAIMEWEAWNGSNPNAQESEAVGGTPLVIEDAGGDGSVAQGNTGTPTASTVDPVRMSTGPTLTATSGGGPVAQGVNGNPTVSTEDAIRARSGATPTMIENTSNVGPMATKGTARTAGHGRSLRMVSGTSPTVIENTSNVGPVAEGISGSNAEGGPVETHCAEGTANVAFNDRETRATSGATTTVITRGGAVGGTAVVFHLNTILGTNKVGPVAQAVGGNPTVLMPTDIHCTQGSANVAMIECETRAVSGTSPTVITRGDDVGGTPTAHRLRLVRLVPRHSVAAANGSVAVITIERLAA